MNIPETFEDHITAELKNRLMFKEMQESLFLQQTRSSNDFLTAFMPSPNTPAVANHTMQIHMMLQQYLLRSAFYSQQHAALKTRHSQVNK